MLSQRRRKEWAFRALAFLLAVLVVETASRAAIRVLEPDAPRGASYLPGYEECAAANPNLVKLSKDSGYQGYQIAHPLWGFQVAPPESNNYGFESRHPFPYKKGPKEFVIGIFGGSVANGFAASLDRDPRLAEEFQRTLRPGSGWRLVFLNMSEPAMKQPQQFMVAANFAETLDCAITLDGFNDVLGLTHVDLPEEYPTLTGGLYFRPRDRGLESRIYSLRSAQARLLGLPRRWPLISLSSTYYLVFSRLFPYLGNRASLLDSERIYRSALTVGRLNSRSLEERHERRRTLWEKYSRLQTLVLASYGVPNFHFLQPSAHLEGSKPFSADEAKMRAGIGDLALADKGYQDLVAAMSRLSGKGRLEYDLTRIFSATRDTVYIDGHCHLNDLGNRLMARAMAEKMREVLRRRLREGVVRMGMLDEAPRD